MANPDSRASGIARLPTEILVQISENLDYRSWSHLAQTNAGINSIMRDDLMRLARDHAFVPEDKASRFNATQPQLYYYMPNMAKDPISKAIENHNYFAVKNYLDAGVDPSSSLITGLRLLFKAAIWKAHDITTLLLSYGADANACNVGDSCTAVAAAASKGDNNNVRRLLRAGANVHSMNAIHGMCEFCTVDTVRLAVTQYGADLRQRSVSELSGSAIHHAALNPEAEVLEYVLEVAPDLLNDTAVDNKTALWPAIEKLLLRNIGILINEGINISHRDNNNETVLYNRLYIIGNTEIPMYLLSLGMSVNGASRQDGKTELHHAVFDECEELAAALIEHGLSANARDNGNRTPLHLAVYSGAVSMARILVEQGHASLDAVDHWGYTPLTLAHRHRKLALAAYLEEAMLPGRLPA